MPGSWLTSPAGWLSRTGISSGTLRSVIIEYGFIGLPVILHVICIENLVKFGHEASEIPAATSLRFTPAWRWWYTGSVVVDNVGDKQCQQLSSIHTHNSCRMSRWTTPHPSVICVELLWGSRQPLTGRLATHPSNTTVCALQRLSQVLYKRKVAVSLVMGTSENGDGGVTHTFPCICRCHASNQLPWRRPLFVGVERQMWSKRRRMRFLTGFSPGKFPKFWRRTSHPAAF